VEQRLERRLVTRTETGDEGVIVSAERRWHVVKIRAIIAGMRILVTDKKMTLEHSGQLLSSRLSASQAAPRSRRFRRLIRTSI
jgi:hypothetical protein